MLRHVVLRYVIIVFIVVRKITFKKRILKKSTHEKNIEYLKTDVPFITYLLYPSARLNFCKYCMLTFESIFKYK